MTIKDKILKLASYEGTNFFNLDAIGLIARGPSIRGISKCYSKFSHCILAGEFNNNLDSLESFLSSKDIVLSAVQTKRYRTPPDKCRKFNIKNLQIIHQYGTPQYNDLVSHYEDLRVVGYTVDQVSEMKRIFGKISEEEVFGVWTTGIAALFNASYFRPKEIFIMGIDFYNEKESKYFTGEPHDDIGDTVEYSAQRMREGMLRDFYSICKGYPEIKFNIYTTFTKLEKMPNLTVFEV